VLANRPENTIIATTATASATRQATMEAIGATVVCAPTRDGRIDLAALLAELATHNIRSILVEGGAAIITSFLRQRLADRLVIFIAPKILGTGLSGIGDLGIDTMDGAVRLEEPSLAEVGQDVVVRGALLRANLIY
jgi:riboflavin-specific deaminase-like protein